ncbi:hypothetical protein M0811_14183 [Anaeramoeba ignava]|uniref:Uncharacterized protein n=1 Tax=Anaeramoeba ignava TaxID=1746090 RepID=A0A9Q0RGH7_ANAIG|nr:hypothetical protein M0811_14183 [Anaeramoeba ignava]
MKNEKENEMKMMMMNQIQLLFWENNPFYHSDSETETETNSNSDSDSNLNLNENSIFIKKQNQESEELLDKIESQTKQIERKLKKLSQNGVSWQEINTAWEINNIISLAKN